MSLGVSQNKSSLFGSIEYWNIKSLENELRKSTHLISGKDLNKSILVLATSELLLLVSDL
jgi:hypothetical protein